MVPVTLIEAGTCYITQIKTEEKDGYDSLQIGCFEAKKLTKPEEGHLKKIDKKLRFLRECRVKNKEDLKGFKEGDAIDISIFKQGQVVSVSGISKGKGFAGVIKRWGFHSKPATHGQKHEERALGSVGSRFPQHVIKGKKMAGHLGSERVTVKNLKVAKVDKENNLLAVEGAIPGRRGALIEIRAQ